MDKPKLLIVDDDENVRSQMKWALSDQYEVFQASDRPAALETLALERPGVVTLDLGLPPSPGDPREGLLALADLLHLDPRLKVIVITGQGEKENALQAIGQGAYDFFCKPIDIEELKVVLGRAMHVYRLECENLAVLESMHPESFEGMLGASPRMQTVFGAIRKVATTDAPVLIVGESGTGKELAARAIHRLSLRKNGPFVVINCGAIPENLLESELFGHEKGSFTGAHIQRHGRIEAAQGGTLLLDEIGELTPPLQVKLLRFLQEQQIERVGGRQTIKVDARVLSATNTDLRKAMEEGRFLEDLYFRLAVVVIPMPPLRERDGDVLFLAKAFLQRYSSKEKKTMMFTRKALNALDAHGWPGNIRELENRIKGAVIMAERGKITAEDLELAAAYSKYDGKGLAGAREAVERELISRALAKHKGNLTRTAAELNVSRPTLYDLIGKLGIDRK